MPSLEGQTLKGRYRIGELLGHGGMAEVYRAWDEQRTYHVAVKVLREDLAEDREFDRRFRREAESLAALSHRNIVRFYSYERAGPLAFIVMDYVEGITLRRRLFDADGPLPVQEALSIVQQVASALHYAHSEGVLNRDVKPGNVMLQPDGRALVADLGIAKATDAATATTVMPGTPAYMSPEQCRSEPLDARSDVYSLGVTTYEMLAGRRPFVGDSERGGTTGSTGERIRWEHMHAAPPPLRPLNPAVAPELEQVVLRALAKGREQRWGSALAFAQAFVRACGSAQGEASGRVATPPRERAQDQPVAARPAAPAFEPRRAQAGGEAGAGERGRAALPEALPERPAREPLAGRLPHRRRVAGWVWLAIGLLVVGVVWMAVSGIWHLKPEPTVTATRTASPTPTHTATAARTPKPTPTATYTPTATPIPVKLPVRSGTPVPRPGEAIGPGNAGQVVELARRGKGWLHDMAYSPDGRWLAVGSSAGVWLYDAGTLEEVRVMETGWAISVAFSPDGALLASGSSDDTVRLWRVSDGTSLRTLKGHTDDVRSVAFSPDGTLLASGSDDHTERLWWVSDGASLHTLEGHEYDVTSVAFSPDGTLLASGSMNGTVRLWGVVDR